MTDAQTLKMILGGSKVKIASKPKHKFFIGMNVIYGGKPATIFGKEGRRYWIVRCDGQDWRSTGNDMRPA